MDFTKDDITEEMTRYVDIDIKATIVMARNDYLKKHGQTPEPYSETLQRLTDEGVIAEEEISLILARIQEKEKEAEETQNYLRVMLPNSGPIMLVTFILSFVWYWNDYINVSLFFNNAKPLAVLLEGLGPILLTMRTPDGLAFGEIEKSVYTTTFCLLFILPPIILYAFLQKRFTKSLMNTSIVG